MDKIEKALRCANKEKIKFYGTFFVVLVFIIGIILWQQIIKKNTLGIIIISIIALAFVSLFVFLVRRIHSQNKFEKSSLAKKLAKRSDAELYEFISNIDYEMENELLIDYYDKIFKVNLFITKTWFIFISDSSSVIRKTSELSKFGIGFNHEHSYFFLSVKFSDNSFLSKRCCYEEILDEVEKVFPELVSR